MTSEPWNRGVLEEVISARHGFGHREHLELAWRYLGKHDLATAQTSSEDAIRHVAASHGRPDQFHRTMTWSWVLLVAVHRQHFSARSFDEFIAAHPALLDKELVSRHYLPETLGSAAARAQWVEPDRLAFPPVGVGA
jgi:hypothetical protein